MIIKILHLFLMISNNLAVFFLRSIAVVIKKKKYKRLYQRILNDNFLQSCTIIYQTCKNEELELSTDRRQTRYLLLYLFIWL